MRVLAADTGGTRVKLGLVEIDGDAAEVVAEHAVDAHADRGLRAALPALADALGALDPDGTAAALGVSFPSIVVGDRVTTSFGKYVDAPDVDLVGWARDALGLPAAVDNDARCAAVGEWRFGAGRGTDDLVVVTLGTGIGTCPIVGGRPLRGAHGQAGILGGHLAVPGPARPCVCGNVGCAEAAGGTATLPDRARARADFAASALAARDRVDYAAVFALAADGDACAVALRDGALAAWSAAVVNLVHAYDPARVVLGGGVMRSAGVILPFVRDWVGRHACTPWGAVEVVAAARGDAAGLLGAAALAADRLDRPAPATPRDAHPARDPRPAPDPHPAR